MTAGSIRLLVAALGLLFAFGAAVRPASAACLANGKTCGVSSASNDRLCCPGSICGPWGNTCQPGCRIGGVAYRGGTINPANSCQVCQPNKSTTTWSSVPNGTGCTDANACTQTDSCQSGTCTGANPVVCAALDQCHAVGTCDSATGQCSNPTKPNGTPCADGSACTQTDTCQAGACTGANPVVCAALDQCHAVGTCDSATGQCSNPTKANGTPCADGSACTQTDTCQAGACTGANPVVCVASDQCHLAGTCNSATGLCSNPTKGDGTACDDGIAATTGDFCQGGICTALRACCDGTGDCADRTPTDCAAATGSLGADGSSCSTGVCRARTVFVTSTKQNGNLDGFESADLLCAQLASSAGLVGTFKAWLTDATTNAAARLFHSPGPWYLPDGTTRVARNWSDLVDGAIENPINQTESGAAVACCEFYANLVWTGTTGQGTLPGEAFTCASWTSDSATVNGDAGLAYLKNDGAWSFITHGPCSTAARLYCFEQE